MNIILLNLNEDGTLGLLAKLLQAVRVRFSAPLSITLSNRELRFRRFKDFKFSMAPRTAVPALRFNTLCAHTRAELESEASTIHTLEQQLGRILEEHQRHGIPCKVLLKKLGVRMFSKDHDWRAIFEQLGNARGVRDIYTRLALSTYLKYLASRQEVIRQVIDLGRSTVQPTQPLPADKTAFAPDRSTVIFNAGETAEKAQDPSLCRLPQGEAVFIRLENGEEISIRLAKVHFSLSHDEDWSLRADNGRCYTLRAGVNSVGRGRDNDISVAPDLRTVSRKHLLAEPLGLHGILLTDVSSCGTYIPTAAMA